MKYLRETSLLVCALFFMFGSASASTNEMAEHFRGIARSRAGAGSERLLNDLSKISRTYAGHKSRGEWRDVNRYRANVRKALDSSLLGTQYAMMILNEDVALGRKHDLDHYQSLAKDMNYLFQAINNLPTGADKGRFDPASENWKAQTAIDVAEVGVSFLFAKTDKIKKVLDRTWNKLPESTKSLMLEVARKWGRQGAESLIDLLSSSPDKFSQFLIIAQNDVSRARPEIVQAYLENEALQIGGALLQINPDYTAPTLDEALFDLDEVKSQLKLLVEQGSLDAVTANRLSSDINDFLSHYEKTGKIDLSLLSASAIESMREMIEDGVSSEKIDQAFELAKQKEKRDENIKVVQASLKLGSSLASLGRQFAIIAGSPKTAFVFEQGLMALDVASEVYDVIASLPDDIAKMTMANSLELASSMVNVYAFAINFAFSMMSWGEPDPTFEMLKTILTEVRSINTKLTLGFNDVKDLLRSTLEGISRIEQSQRDFEVRIARIEINVERLLGLAHDARDARIDDETRQLEAHSSALTKYASIVASGFFADNFEFRYEGDAHSSAYDGVLRALKALNDDYSYLVTMQARSMDGSQAETVRNRASLKLRSLCIQSGFALEDCSEVKLFDLERGRRAARVDNHFRHARNLPWNRSSYLDQVFHYVYSAAQKFSRQASLFGVNLAANLGENIPSEVLNRLRLSMPQESTRPKLYLHPLFEGHYLIPENLTLTEMKWLAPSVELVRDAAGSWQAEAFARQSIAEIESAAAKDREALFMAPFSFDRYQQPSAENYIENLLTAYDRPLDIDHVVRRMAAIREMLPFVVSLAQVPSLAKSLGQTQRSKSLESDPLIAAARELLTKFNDFAYWIDTARASISAYEGFESIELYLAEGQRLYQNLIRERDQVASEIVWSHLSDASRKFVASSKNKSAYYYLYEIWTIIEELDQANRDQWTKQLSGGGLEDLLDEQDKKARKNADATLYLERPNQDDPKRAFSKAYVASRNGYRHFYLESSPEKLSDVSVLSVPTFREIFSPRNQELDIRFFAFPEDSEFLDALFRLYGFDDRSLEAVDRSFDFQHLMEALEIVLFNPSKDVMKEPVGVLMTIAPSTQATRVYDPTHLRPEDKKKWEEGRDKELERRKLLLQEISRVKPLIQEAAKRAEGLEDILLRGASSISTFGKKVSKAPLVGPALSSNERLRAGSPLNTQDDQIENLVVLAFYPTPVTRAGLNQPQQPGPRISLYYYGPVTQVWLAQARKAEKFLVQQLKAEMEEILGGLSAKIRSEVNREGSALRTSSAYKDYEEWLLSFKDFWIDMRLPSGSSDEMDLVDAEIEVVETLIKDSDPAILSSQILHTEQSKNRDFSNLRPTDLFKTPEKALEAYLSQLDLVQESLEQLSIYYGAITTRREGFEVHAAEIQNILVENHLKESGLMNPATQMQGLLLHQVNTSEGF